MKCYQKTYLYHLKLNSLKLSKIIILALAIVLASAACKQHKINSNMETHKPKKVNVWDTYVTKKDGNIMHFDIIAPVEISDTAVIYQYGKDYLKTKNQEGQPLTSKQCRLCHIEHLRPEWEVEIDDKGYFIIEMEGCK